MAFERNLEDPQLVHLLATSGLMNGLHTLPGTPSYQRMLWNILHDQVTSQQILHTFLENTLRHR